MGKNMRRMLAVVVLALLMGPVTGSLVVNSDPVGWETVDEQGLQWTPSGYSLTVPQQAEAAPEERERRGFSLSPAAPFRATSS